MKKHLLTCLLGFMALSMGAQSFQEWKDPRINEVNRAPMHANYFAYESADAAKKGVKENSANFMSLNGSWKFFWVKDADARPTDVWLNGRRLDEDEYICQRSGQATFIHVVIPATQKGDIFFLSAKYQFTPKQQGILVF